MSVRTIEKFLPGPVVCATNSSARLRRVADYQAGTDAGVAIQAAIDAAGQDCPTTILPGFYEFETPIVPRQSMILHGVSAGALSIDRTTSTHLSFVGGPTDSAIAYTSTTSLSRVEIGKLRLTDDRAAKTSGSGILLKHAINRVVLREMFINGFPDNGIYVGADSGRTSDCITIDDVWAMGGVYGVNVERLDNSVILTGIKGDSYASASSPMQALIRVGGTSSVPATAAIIIQGIKHECSNGADTVLLDTTFGAAHVDSVVQRSSTGSGGGYVVRITGSEGSGAVCTNLSHSGSAAGVIRNDLRSYTVSRNPLAFWAGGLRGFGINDWSLTGLNGSSPSTLIAVMRGHLRYEADNTYDIGRDSLRPRFIYAGSKVLAAGGIGVGNSAAATTLGTVTKKIEVFDAAGASLGFIPVYDAIT